MKKIRFLAELLLILIVGGVWYTIISFSVLYYNVKREFRKTYKA
jgi:hypothetical protein